MCGANEILFDNDEINLMWQLIEVFNISFSSTNQSHIKILKALYYKIFVQYETNKGNSNLIFETNIFKG